MEQLTPSQVLLLIREKNGVSFSSAVKRSSLSIEEFLSIERNPEKASGPKLYKLLKAIKTLPSDYSLFTVSLSHSLSKNNQKRTNPSHQPPSQSLPFISPKGIRRNRPKTTTDNQKED